MSQQEQIVYPGPDDHSVRSARGEILHPPPDWILVPPGDAALTRRIKAAGPTWTVQEKRGRKIFSRGVWAAHGIVEAIRKQLAAERLTPAHARKRDAEVRRRQRQQADYVEEFRRAVFDFLAFAPRYENVADKLAAAVAAHATPVGSGRVARTQRIPVEKRAEAAVIAWMRHQTTAYEQMVIPRVKGKRRQVRRLLAERSRAVLSDYRRGAEIDSDNCPVQRALTS